ncbi:MAG: hypothetical protein QNI86_13820, partial [Halieaceae bacterium]|nr:hypothetical protein [Halieaceae bacterium]
MADVEPQDGAPPGKSKGRLLSGLRTLVPSRIMVGCLTLIGVAGGWYYFSSQAKADHLIKRNFNYLNQVASNINATTQAVEAALVFNNSSIYACLEERLVENPATSGGAESGQDKQNAVAAAEMDDLRTALTACLNAVKQRLLRNGPMIQDSRDMEIVMSVEDRSMPSHLFNLRRICRGEDEFLIEPFQPSLVNPTPGGLLYMFYFHATAASGGCAEKGKRNVVVQTPEGVGKTHLVVNVSVRVPFTRVQGFAQEETYFDAIALARSDGSEAKVIFTNTEAGIRIDQRDLRSLFTKRSGFERFTSLREQEIQHSALQQRLQAGRDAVKPTTNATQFTQSTFLPTVVGGFTNLAFIQPFRFYKGEYSQSDDLVLVGFTSETAFNTDKYSIPLNWLSYLLLLFFGAALSLNFVRLRLIRERGVVHRTDVLLATFSLVGIGVLVVVYFVHRLGSFQFNEFYDEDLETVHGWIKSSFHSELNHKIETLETAGFALYHASSPDLGEDSQCPPLE